MMRAVTVLGLSLVSTLAWGAGPRVNVVVEPGSPGLERAAADEIAGQLRRLYQADVAVVASPPEDAEHVILVGSPATNSQMREWAGRWPKLTDQGHCLESVTLRGRPALLIGGGSPAATYWAVAEYGHRLGIRSMLYGELDPVAPPPFTLDGFHLVLEPTLRVRAWRTINDFPIGPESWGIEEQRRVIRQLARQKYNRIVVSVHAWQPFVHFEFGGVAKETGVLWYGWKYPVTGDTAGRGALAGMRSFENPDFAGKDSYVERVAAGKSLLRGIIASAHEMGMTVGILLSPLEFPREFARALPQSRKVRGLEDLTIGPGPAQRPDDAMLTQLARTQIRAYLDAYQELDAVYLSLPEFPEWGEHAEGAWELLSRAAGERKLPTLEKLVESARHRGLTASGERGATAVRGNLTALAFLRHLLDDRELFRRSDGHEREIQVVQPDPALFASLAGILPQGTKTLHFVDYTARRVWKNRGMLAAVPARHVPSSLIMTLADDNLGVLPQSSHSTVAQLLGELRQGGWEGFVTRYWCVGDLDLSSYILSRGSFDPALTADQACRDLVTPVCGEGVSDRVLKGLSLIEQATAVTDDNDLGFSFPVPDVVMKHYASDAPPPEWWHTVRDHYLHAMNEMYRANTRAREGGRSFTLYFARRSEFGFSYMTCMEAVRNAGIARRAKDAAAQRAQLEAAVDSMTDALNAMAAVARSNSDRGVIAVLNEYGYRPLVRELESLDE